jgi:hypothetical protein
VTHELTPEQERARVQWANSLATIRELFPNGPPQQVTLLLSLATFKLMPEPRESTLIYHAAQKEAIELWTRFYGTVDDDHKFFYPPRDQEEG